MSIIVCSPSTQNFLEGEKFIVHSPPTKNILSLQKSFKDVIAIGGGAVIDTAKILSKNPITCYPTTAAGATATSHSVYWDGDNKLNFNSHIPKKVIHANNPLMIRFPNLILFIVLYYTILYIIVK